METLTESQKTFVAKLNEYSQDHLFSSNPSEAQARQLVEQLERADKTCAGGLFSYLERAKKLLQDSAKDVNPFEDLVPEVPDVQKMVVGTDVFADMEKAGAKEIAATCFVMVSGGLGERLGWPDVKISLPSETSTNTSFMELYAKQILALQSYATTELKTPCVLPLAIMTSDDTHAKASLLLKNNNNFGLSADQVHIVKQEKVPCLKDSEARMATKANDRYTLEMKPHGHGDVHSLLSQHGLANKWTQQGKKWIVFFQDTNSLILRCVPCLLGVSATHNYVMNSVTIPRQAKEAMGAICKLKGKDGSALTINVEYNQLDGLLRSNFDKGDEADENGSSAYPGNCNVLALRCERYAEVLEKSNATVPEFVNPKYADKEKTKFASSVRLECMMQDFPKLLTAADNVGCTEFERWMSFSTVKNHRDTAIQKSSVGLPSESAYSGEADHYTAGANLLRMAAEKMGCAPVDVPVSVPTTIGGVAHFLGPRVVLMPSFAVSFEHLKKRLENAKNRPMKLSATSSLVLEGEVQLQGLVLDGALVVTGPKSAATGAPVVVYNTTVTNRGWELCALKDEDCIKDLATASPSAQSLRGFTIAKHEQMEIKC